MSDVIVACGYARVSTDSEDQKNSFKNQCNYFENAINSSEDYKFHKLYYDEGLSGVSWKKREGFNEMLRDAGLDVVREWNRRTKQYEIKYYSSKRKPLFNEIWIKNTARFARNTFSFEVIILLRKKGVYVRFITQNIYTKDPSQDFMLKMMMNMDENESRLKSEAVRWGYERGAESGKIYTSTNITGFDYDPKTNTLKKNKDAPTIKLIFDLYTEDGLGIRRIINELEQRGIKSPSGKKRWGSTSLKNILHNEKYAGMNNALKYDHGEFGERNWGKVKEHYNITPSEKIEAIITYEQFLKAKKIMGERVTNYNNQIKGKKIMYSEYSKKLTCKKCGGHFQRDTDYKDEKKTKKYHFYRCSTKKRLGVKFCDCPNVQEEDIDLLVKNYSYGKINTEIERRRLNYENMLLQVALNELDEISEESEAVSTILKKKIEEKRKQAESYFVKWMENKELDKHGIFQNMINEINKEIDELEEQQKQVSEYNGNIYADVISLVEAFEKIRVFKNETKKRYTKEETLDMIDFIFVHKSFSNPKKSTMMPTFRCYREARELLSKYEKKYKFHVEDFEKAKTTDEKKLLDENNAYYKKIKEKLEGVYATA